MPAFRRQHPGEIRTALSDFDATGQHTAELYTGAVEQLGSDNYQVRFGGLYVLEWLAQDNPAYRQAIVNVICAYLRMPFSPAAPASKLWPAAADGWKEPGAASETEVDGIGRTWQQERQVRLRAQRILTEHLGYDRPEGRHSADRSSSRFWNNISLNLAGATLIDFNLVNGVIADADFHRAAFSGDADFHRAAFSGDVRFGEAAFEGDALFGKAAFSRGAGFRRAAFGGGAGFRRATFAGDAWFDQATFAGDAWFREAAFGGDARFRTAAFTGSAWFDKATFSRGASFDGTAFTSDAWFGEAAFSGDAGFGEATFSGAAGFGKATFSRGASFGEATFNGDAGFGEAVLSGSVWFGEATFSGGADALHFERARILSPGASHVWPAGWRLADAGGGEYTVVRADDDGSS
jgi:Pentapeptide repeats (9 copies)